ncbi:hypothetical protein Val02_74540 [Virgisporangium aliadipatigenens]|uniref:Uncharacterized protein n=1 Tax=Virgisporangium aliadipatigenens TaxID=741659 RepID=A0A8J3YU82_9ACTN|nr:hypothetical protein Val02_74540 [Virgisporangium aliadipatigenens]
MHGPDRPECSVEQVRALLQPAVRPSLNGFGVERAGPARPDREALKPDPAPAKQPQSLIWT